MKRFPGREDTLAVYAVIVMILYGWTTVHFLWKVPSWSFFLPVTDLLSILAYGFTTNLVESLVVLGVLLGASRLLPRTWLLDSFPARGTAAALTGLGYIALLSNAFRTNQEADYPAQLIRLFPVALLSILAACFLAGRVRLLRAAMEGLASRAAIFLYLSIPLSVLAVAVVLARNF
jgi:hypothetical protein